MRQVKRDLKAYANVDMLMLNQWYATKYYMASKYIFTDDTLYTVYMVYFRELGDLIRVSKV